MAGAGVAGAEFCTVLAAGTLGQRVATDGAAFQIDVFVEVASLAPLPAGVAATLAGGLATGLSWGRNSARASATDGFAGGEGAVVLFCGTACDTLPSSRRRYQQLRLLTWSM
ncbi:hypothetical protein [Bradyrhizobium sp.]|uniref:hypothetical protein n=1 Tax=Bradyrhizobium sp. TaxID=376 RepID=UPI00263979CA|nr:hypothetical protein [Bradyrhizobium sp.]